jgi:hypothetical protein
MLLFWTAAVFCGSRFVGLDFTHPERYIFLKDLGKLRGDGVWIPVSTGMTWERKVSG